MKKIFLSTALVLFLVFFIFRLSNRNDEILVNFKSCDGLKWSSSYKLVNNKIINKIYLKFEEGVMEPGDITELDNCTIIDAKNWTCGGHISKYGGTYPKYLLMDGKFSYIKGSNERKDCDYSITQLR